MSMHRLSSRTIAWGLRVMYVIIIFWWPAILQDPIYTPRHARLTGQELHPPMGISSSAEDAQALAIFWSWEHRSLVSSHWILGPYRGIRAPEGRIQTLIMLLLFWGAGSLLLSRWDSRTTLPGELPRQRGVVGWLATPIWQWFTRRP